MKKVKFLQILLTLLTIVAFVLLTGEIFMDMRPLFLKIYAVSGWVALFGMLLCALIYSIQSKKKNKEKAS